MAKGTKKEIENKKKEKIAEEANFSSEPKKLSLIEKIKKYFLLKKQSKINKDEGSKSNNSDATNVAVDGHKKQREPNHLSLYTFRLIKTTKTRFASLVSITLIGTAFLMGLSSVAPTMEHTIDKFGDRNNLFDIRIYSNYGFSDDDLDAISEIDGVEQVEGSHFFDCYAKQEDGAKTVVRLQEIDNSIGSITLKSGRMPENENECLALYSEHSQFNNAIGSKVTLLSDGDKDLDEYISQKTFTIVGLAETPEYMTYVSETSTVNNLGLSDVYFVSSDLFQYDYYTVASVTIEGAKNYDSFTDKYEDYISAYIDKVELLAQTQKDSNRDAIIGKAQAQLDEAQAELDYQKQLGQTKLDAAKAQLSAAYAKLLMGSASIDAGEEVIDTLEDLYDEKKAQIDEGSAQIEQAKKQVEVQSGLSFDDTFTNMSAVYAIYNSLNTNKVSSYVSSYKDSIQEELDGYNKELEDNKALQEELERQLTEIIHEIGFLNQAQLEQEYSIGDDSQEDEETLTEIIENPSFVENTLQASLESELEQEETESQQQEGEVEVLEKIPEVQILTLNESDNDEEPEIIDYSQMIEYKKEMRKAIILKIVELRTEQFWLEVKIEIDENEIDLIDNYGDKAVTSIVEGLQYELENITGVSDIPGTYKNLLDIQTGQIKVDASGQLLSETRKLITENESTIEQATIEVEQGTRQYRTALDEYNNQEEQFNKSIEEAQIKLDKAQQDLDELEEGQWTIIDRNSHVSSVLLEESTNQMKIIGTAIPIMFFFVAALVCLTTMTRLIEEKRSEIGGLLSIGYSKQEIIKEYVRYAFVASAVGSLIGTFLGLFTLPKMIYIIWQLSYRLPDMVFYIPLKNLLISISSFVVLMCVVTYFVLKENLKETAASLLRPKAPKSVKKTFIENIDVIWSRLSLTGRITARNIIRYKQRFFMTILGIAGCVGLLILGFGLKDSIGKIPTHFGGVIHYTHIINIDDNDDSTNFIVYLNEHYPDSNPISVLSYNSKGYTGDTDATFLVYVLNEGQVSDFITLKEYKTNKTITLDDSGVAISNKFATKNNVKVGDKLIIESDAGIKKEVTISHIFECYVYDDIVMTDTYYQEVFGVRPDHNNVFFTYNGDEDLSDELAKIDGFDSVSDTNSTHTTINELVESLNLVIVIVISFAGMLAFVVLINLTEVNISERKRELATLKVLGFSKIEVRNYIFKELIILTVIGAIVGIPLGYLAHAYLISIIEYNQVYIPPVVNPSSVFISLGLTFFFLFLILLVEIKPIKDIKMVESLKSVE